MVSVNFIRSATQNNLSGSAICSVIGQAKQGLYGDPTRAVSLIGLLGG